MFCPSACFTLEVHSSDTVSSTTVDMKLIRKCRYNTLDPTKTESTATDKEVHGRREEESEARLLAGVWMTLTNRWNKECFRSKVSIVNLQHAALRHDTREPSKMHAGALQSHHKICVLWMDTTYLSFKRQGAMQAPVTHG